MSSLQSSHQEGIIPCTLANGNEGFLCLWVAVGRGPTALTGDTSPFRVLAMLDSE